VFSFDKFVFINANVHHTTKRETVPKTYNNECDEMKTASRKTQKQIMTDLSNFQSRKQRVKHTRLISVNEMSKMMTMGWAIDDVVGTLWAYA
jgi:galactokinase